MLKTLVVIAALAILGASVSPAAAASDTVLVKGHVTDTAGKRLSGVTVLAVASEYPDEEEAIDDGTDVTDGSGYYSIRVDRHSYVTLSSGTKTWIETAKPSVKVGQPSKLVIDLTVAKPATITGRVTDAAGTPLKNTYVFADAGTTATASSSATGAYRLTGLRPGTYTFSYSRDAYLVEKKTITVVEGQKLTGQAVVLTKSTKITGTVTVNGVEADGDLGLVTATLFNATGAQVEQDRVTLGDFAFGKLTPGTFRLQTCVTDAAAVSSCSDYPEPITVVTGESRVVDVNLTSAGTFASDTHVTAPAKTVKWGAKVKVVASVSSYGVVADGTVSLVHHGKVVAHRKLGTDGKVSFTVDTRDWKNDPGTHSVSVRVLYGGVGVTDSAAKTSFRIS